MGMIGSFTGIGVAPSVTGAVMTGSVLVITFSEPMDVTSGLTDPTKYTIPGVTVSRAAVVSNSNDTQVSLYLTGYIAATDYVVTVNTALKDKAGNNLA
jgi:hypothetical protein